MIPPFGDGTDPNALSNLLDSLLDNCRFTPFAGRKLDHSDTYFLSSEETQKVIKPQFEIVVDGMDELNNRLPLSPDDLTLGLSVRSPHLRKYVILERWDIDSIPGGPWSPDSAKLEGLQTGRGMDFIFVIQVAKTRRQLAAQGLSRGKVLCRKVFSIKESIESFTFPFEWVDFGGATGYPEEALWVIEWSYPDDGGRFERPVNEVLTVFGNKKAESSLATMGDFLGAHDLAWRMLAADITTQIWADVLANTDLEPEANDTDTLAGQVFARLSGVSGRPYAEIKGLAKQDDSRNDLRNLVARIFRVVT